MNPQFPSFKKRLANPLAFKFFLLTKLPSAFFAGLKIEVLEHDKAVISVRQKWFNTNPFRSIYFAILSMAAEVSTGILCMAAIYKRNPAVSMLVVKMEGSFHKKATGKILFTCEDGGLINDAVETAIKTGEGTIVTCKTIGTNNVNEIVAEFNFTWSFKSKKQ